MHYEIKDLNFYFELPDGWYKYENKHYWGTLLTFYGPTRNFETNSEIIQIKFGGIEMRYKDISARKEFLKEEGAEIIDGKLGNETNVVILKKSDTCEISAVRDSIQYCIAYSNDKATNSAIDQLCISARFGAKEKVDETLKYWSKNQKAARLIEVISAGPLEEKRELLKRIAIPQGNDIYYFPEGGEYYNLNTDVTEVNSNTINEDLKTKPIIIIVLIIVALAIFLIVFLMTRY